MVWRTGRRVTLAWFWAGSGRVFAFLADLGSSLGSATSRNLRYSASGCQGKSQQPQGQIIAFFAPSAGGDLGGFL